MTPLAPGPTARSSARRPSLLLVSAAVRAIIASGGVALIWLMTGWAMGWW